MYAAGYASRPKRGRSAGQTESCSSFSTASQLSTYSAWSPYPIIAYASARR